MQDMTFVSKCVTLGQKSALKCHPARIAGSPPSPYSLKVSALKLWVLELMEWLLSISVAAMN